MIEPVALPQYLVRAIDEQQQRQQVANLGMQDVLSIAADYVAEQTGLTRRQVVEQYRYDGASFVPAPKDGTPAVPAQEQSA